MLSCAVPKKWEPTVLSDLLATQYMATTRCTALRLVWQCSHGFGNGIFLVRFVYLRRELRDDSLFAFLFYLPVWGTSFFYNLACTKYSVKTHAMELPLRL